MCVEHYVALLPYKLKRWVTCLQPQDLEDTVLLMEAYMSSKGRVYLKKNLQKQAAQAVQNTGARKGTPQPLPGEPPAEPPPVIQQIKAQRTDRPVFQLRAAQILPSGLSSYGLHLGEIIMRGASRIPQNLSPRAVYHPRDPEWDRS